jgi:hypothetical protein
MFAITGVLRLLSTLRQLLSGLVRPRAALTAEDLCRQLALYRYNAPPRMSLGPGIPDPPKATTAPQQPRHRLKAEHVRARSILGGLHHEYALSA